MSGWIQVKVIVFSVSEWRENTGCAILFSRLHHYWDYGEPCSVEKVRLVTRGTNGKVRQSLGQLWFPNLAMLAMGH